MLSPNYAPLWIADQAGLFKKHGLDVQLIYISAGSMIVPAILSGQVKLANMSSAPALTAWALLNHRDVPIGRQVVVAQRFAQDQIRPAPSLPAIPLSKPKSSAFIN